MIPYFFFGFFDRVAEPVQQLIDTHDGFWRKQWTKKKKDKPIVAEEIAELIAEVVQQEIVKPKVKTDKPLFDYYTKSLELQQQIAKKLEQIYLAEMEADEEEALMLLGIY
jgi:hypothetical protein